MNWDAKGPTCQAALGSALGASRLLAGEHPTEKLPDIRVRYFLRALLMTHEKRLERPNTSHYFTLSAQAVVERDPASCMILRVDVTSFACASVSRGSDLCCREWEDCVC